MFVNCCSCQRYDPAELFIDPDIALPKLKIVGRLAQKKLGFRSLLDVIPLDGGLVRGSHGRTKVPLEEKPVLIGSVVEPDRRYKATDVFGTILELVRVLPAMNPLSQPEPMSTRSYEH